MKKLLGIFVLVMMVTTMTAQTSGIYNRFQTNPEIEKDFGDLQNRLSFTEGDWFYMFSYDEACPSCADNMWGANEKRERDLWLMRTKNGNDWSRATTSPIRTDWMTKLSHDWYYPLTDKGAQVVKYGDGKIMVVLTCHKNSNTFKSGVDESYDMIINIIPIRNNMYSVVAKGQMK